MSAPDPSPKKRIQPNKPPVPDPAIQANRPAGAVPPSLGQSTFLARLRRLLEMHKELSADKPKPAMWGGAQFGGLLLGVALGYGVYQELVAAEIDKEMAGVAFLFFTIVGGVLPDLLLKVIRRSQSSAAHESILDFIRKTLRNYPNEVDECGGVPVLADRVELEALIHILQEKYPPPDEAPLPPLKP